MILSTAEITIENLTSVQISHSSQAIISLINTTYGILPDNMVKITVPTEKPIHLKLESLSFDTNFMNSDAFLNCENTIILHNNQKLNMYFVGKVPDGSIECRYYSLDQ
jgi:hypothetical protein